MRKTVCLLSLLLNLLLISGISYVLYRKGGIRYLQQYQAILSGQDLSIESFSPYYQSRFSDFLGQAPQTGAVIFAGDSLTEQGDWKSQFGMREILNRGIGGDTTVGLNFRLGEIIKHKPSKLFLMIGIADLRIGREPSAILDQYQKILSRLELELPDTKIYVQSLLPINTDIFGNEIDPEEINLINRELATMAPVYQAKFIDLSPHFKNNKQQLDPALTEGGVHLNAAGYRKWAGLIRDHLQE